MAVDIRIKTFGDQVVPEAIDKGDWIDLRANETVFVPLNGNKMVKLGIAMELPQGYEAYILPRSSTYNKFSVIQANHQGVVDNSYCGDDDEWLVNVICLKSDCVEEFSCEIDGFEQKISVPGTIIHKGDRICQFRIQEVQPKINFVHVESLGNENRSGFGSTGVA